MEVPLISSTAFQIRKCVGQVANLEAVEKRRRYALLPRVDTTSSSRDDTRTAPRVLASESASRRRG